MSGTETTDCSWWYFPRIILARYWIVCCHIQGAHRLDCWPFQKQFLRYCWSLSNDQVPCLGGSEVCIRLIICNLILPSCDIHHDDYTWEDSQSLSGPQSAGMPVYLLHIHNADKAKWVIPVSLWSFWKSCKFLKVAYIIVADVLHIEVFKMFKSPLHATLEREGSNVTIWFDLLLFVQYSLHVRNPLQSFCGKMEGGIALFYVRQSWTC